MGSLFFTLNIIVLIVDLKLQVMIKTKTGAGILAHHISILSVYFFGNVPGPLRLGVFCGMRA